LVAITVAAGFAFRASLAEIGSKLISPTAQLKVSAVPESSLVSVDGVVEDAPAPLTLDELKPGNYQVHVSAKDFEAQTHIVELADGESRVLAVSLRPEISEEEPTPSPRDSPEGPLSIRSQPPVWVYVDGERVGKTPLADHGVSVGSHAVVLRNDELGILREITIEVTEDGVQRNETFKKGTVALVVTPWAEVFYKGKKLGTTPMPAFRLYEGRQELVLKNPEHGRKRITVQVRPGRTTRASARF
jgi:hypothetical protein